MSVLDNHTVEITCPNCGHKIKKLLRWFKVKDQKCPGCAATFNTDQFRRAIEKIERELADLLRSLGKRRT